MSKSSIPKRIHRLFEEFTEIIQGDIFDPRLTEIRTALYKVGFTVEQPEEESAEKLCEAEDGSYIRYVVSLHLIHCRSNRIYDESEGVIITVPRLQPQSPPLESLFTDSDRAFLKYIKIKE